MHFCKLCRVIVTVATASSADPKMCKKCFSDLTFYKRNCVKDLPEGSDQRIRLRIVDAKIRESWRLGGFVPAFWKQNYKQLVCKACEAEFKSAIVTETCDPCKVKEHSYVNLVRVEDEGYRERARTKDGSFRKPDSRKRMKAIDRLHLEYLENYKRGLRVPALWLKRNAALLDK